MVVERRGIFSRLYNGETAFDFVGKARVWFAISGVVILAGLISLATRQLDLGLDFEGGTSWEVPTRTVDVPETRDALEDFGLADAKIQELGRGGTRSIRVQAEEVDERLRDQVGDELADLADVRPNQVSVNEVGPSWGEDISRKALRALIFFLVAITIYITLRFEWKMAIATLAALFHDLLVTVGVYSITGFEVTPATVIAVLTILGYSIYDGIVVFDKIDENTRGLAASGRMTYGDMVNVSLNQVLMRTLNTSITALLPILSLLLVGAQLLGAITLQEFALALLIGLAASAYSSLFIASPVLALLKEREDRYAAIKERLGDRRGPITPAAAAVEAGGVPDREAPRIITPRAGSGVTPRPRKKGRRR